MGTSDQRKQRPSGRKPDPTARKPDAARRKQAAGGRLSARARARERERRRRQRRNLLGVAAAVLVLAGIVAATVLAGRDGGDQATVNTEPGGVQTFSGLTQNHVQTPVRYAQTPPVGGDHDQVWQNCGSYDGPIRNENAVHSQEHGAVWLTYRPDLTANQIERLRGFAERDFVLVSPYPDLPAPVVASAWGKQLRMDSADDPRLEQFVGAFRQGPQTPEPGAPCSSGTGTPR